MLICKVVGHVWATKKEEGLEGLKLMVVQEIDGTGRKRGNTFQSNAELNEENKSFCFR